MGHTTRAINNAQPQPLLAAWVGTRSSFSRQYRSNTSHTRCIVKKRTPAQRQRQACRVADSSTPGNMGQGYASYAPTPQMGSTGMHRGPAGNPMPPATSGWSASVQDGGMPPPIHQGTPPQQTLADSLLQQQQSYHASGQQGGAGQAPSQQQQRHDVDFQRQFWSTVDLCGWTGSVAGAVLFLLTQA